ncbi:hypothetical protein JCM8097_005933 [Rhodosporidiobolus ruineniae]
MSNPPVAVASGPSPSSSSFGEATNSPVVRPPSSRFNWYYSTGCQAIIIGAVSFLGVGMYNALSGLGAGGLASTHTWNVATALLFTFLCVTCIFAPVIINQFNLRWTLSIASCTYSLYAASLYVNSKNGNEWFLILANVLNGIGGGLYYCSEGAIVVGYPEEKRRGRMISIWIFARNLGPIVGGAILLGINKQTNGTGSVSLNSFAAFVGITCAAPFIALLLASPEKVQRKDGTRVVVHKTTLRTEVNSLFRHLRSRKVLLLLPIFFTSWFADSLNSNYTATYLTVRTRALSSFLSPFAGNIASFLSGRFLDSQIGTRGSRATYTLGFFFAMNLAMWAYSAANYAHYTSLPTSPHFDWSSSGFGRAYLIPFFWNFEELGCQAMLYYLLGTISDDLQDLVHLTGILRGIEGAGQAVAYGIASSTASIWVTIGLGFGLVVVSYPLAFLVVRDIEEKEPTVPAVEEEKADSLDQKDLEV